MATSKPAPIPTMVSKARSSVACAQLQRPAQLRLARQANVAQQRLIRCNVLSPVKEDITSTEAAPSKAIVASIDDIRRPVGEDMDVLVKNLLNVVGDRHPMLMAAAQQIFGAGGKKLRPMLVFLVARATCLKTGRCGLWFCTIRVPAESGLDPRAHYRAYVAGISRRGTGDWQKLLK